MVKKLIIVGMVLLLVACGINPHQAPNASPELGATSTSGQITIQETEQLAQPLRTGIILPSPSPMVSTRQLPTPSATVKKPTLTPILSVTPLPAALLSTGEAATLAASKLSSECVNPPWTETGGISDIPGEIYFWDRFSNLYLVYDPTRGLSNLSELAAEESKVPRLGNTIAISFPSDPDTRKFAYLIANQEGLIELWTANVRLCQYEHLWTDTGRWLADITQGFPNDRITISWGPNDSTLIIKSFVNQGHLMIYSLVERIAVERSGECNQISNSGDSPHWSLICTFPDGPDRFGIIQTDGFITLTDSIPDGGAIPVVDWAFSPDSEQALFVSPEYELFLVQAAKDPQELPIHWTPELVDQLNLEGVARRLQWSTDGSKLLVFGYDETGDRCPKSLNPVKGELTVAPCWFVIKPTTLNIEWWLDQETMNLLEIPATDAYSYYEATFSPDSRWIAYSFSDVPLDYFLITSLKTYETVIAAGSTLDLIYWVNKKTG